MTTFENQRLDELEDKLDKVEDKLDKVLDALVGSDLIPGKGMIQNYNLLEARVLKLETLKNKIIYMCFGAGIAGGFSISKIIEWIQEAAK